MDNIDWTKFKINFLKKPLLLSDVISSDSITIQYLISWTAN
jgi:hypothetical protein